MGALGASGNIDSYLISLPPQPVGRPYDDWQSNWVVPSIGSQWDLPWTRSVGNFLWMTLSRQDNSLVRLNVQGYCHLWMNRRSFPPFQVFIRTRKNVIIEVNPKTRIPRTFERFSGLMVQLLHKLSIHAATGGHEKLLKVIVHISVPWFKTRIYR